jgi:hypothetical protein
MSMNWIRLFIVLLSALVLSPLLPQPTLEVRFGILVADDDGSVSFVETTQVPKVAGQAYGWVASVAPREVEIPWSEVLRLPKSPMTWPSAGTDVSDDRTAGQTRGIVARGEQQFSHFWMVTPGDPSGGYLLTLRVFDGVVAEFAFELVEHP